MPESFSIAQVSPYPWEQHHEVNVYVERLADELCQRGHRVVVIAPSSVRELIRDGRELIAAVGKDPDSLFTQPGCAQLLAIGQSLPARRGGAVSLPVDVSKAMEQLLGSAELDFLHVHEPFAPSAASAALRHSHALNIGTFHAPAERVVSTQVARRLVELLFGRLDGRTASFAATRDLVSRYFPGDYRVIHPGADIVKLPDRTGEREIIDIVYSAEEERSALRLFLRALRRISPALPWRATVWARERGIQPNLPKAIRDRVRFTGPAEVSEAQPRRAADVVVAASSGTAPAPQLLFRAMAGGAVPVASRLPTYEETLADGERGLLFELRDADTLAGQLERLVSDKSLRTGFHDRIQALRPELDWSRAADAFEELYTQIAARRKPATNGSSAIRKRLQDRPLIDVDLHMHTDHSPDCATPVDVLLD